jgi:hypothetical protein
MRTLKRRALNRSTGSIMAEPNPVRANYQSELAVTTVTWTSENTKAVEVHVGSLMARVSHVASLQAAQPPVSG